MPRIVAVSRTETADRSRCQRRVVGLERYSTASIKLLRRGGNPRGNSALWNSFQNQKQPTNRSNVIAAGPKSIPDQPQLYSQVADKSNFWIRPESRCNGPK